MLHRNSEVQGGEGAQAKCSSIKATLVPFRAPKKLSDCNISKGQNVLELASVSTISGVVKNSSILATQNGSCADLMMKEQLFVELIALAANALKTSDGC